MAFFFVAVCEEGPGNFTEYRFATEQEAREASQKYWQSWVLYRCDEDEWRELACGGVGMWVGACGTIRRHVQGALAPNR